MNGLLFSTNPERTTTTAVVALSHIPTRSSGASGGHFALFCCVVGVFLYGSVFKMHSPTREGFSVRAVGKADSRTKRRAGTPQLRSQGDRASWREGVFGRTRGGKEREISTGRPHEAEERRASAGPRGNCEPPSPDGTVPRHRSPARAPRGRRATSRAAARSAAPGRACASSSSPSSSLSSFVLENNISR